MSRIAIAVALVPILSTSVAAQTFNPFGEVYGAVTLTGEYCYTCPFADGALERNAAFILGQGGELYLDSKVEGPVGPWGGTPNRGAILSAKWTQRFDDHEDLEATEPPWFVTDAYEWAFELSGVTDEYDGFFLDENIDVSVDLELTEWTEVLMRVEADALLFHAELGGLVASSAFSRDSMCVRSGTLSCDELYHQSMILSPGTHHLSIWGNMWGYRYGGVPLDASVLLRFSPVCGPSIVDINGDGVLDNGDIILFITLFLAGC